MRLDAVHATSGEQHVQRVLLADDPRQRHGEAEAVAQPEPGEVRAEPGGRRGDPEVGGHGQAEPSADRGAVHGGDDRDADVEHAHRLGVEGGGAVGVLARRDRRGAPAVAPEVRPGGEVAALGGEDDHPHRRVRVGLGVEVGQQADHRHVEVVVRGPPQRHQRDWSPPAVRSPVRCPGSAFPRHGVSLSARTRAAPDGSAPLPDGVCTPAVRGIRWRSGPCTTATRARRAGGLRFP